LSGLLVQPEGTTPTSGRRSRRMHSRIAANSFRGTANSLIQENQEDGCRDGLNADRDRLFQHVSLFPRAQILTGTAPSGTMPVTRVACYARLLTRRRSESPQTR
jgi:hypothetical protein